MATNDTPRVYQTPLARLSYPATHIPRENRLDPTKPPMFGGTLIFDIPSIMADEKDKVRLGAMVKVAQEMMKGRFSQATFEGPFMDNSNGPKSPWLDGNAPKYRDKDGLGEGKRFIRTSSNRPVPCIGRARETITDPSKLYPGCYVYGIVAPFTYDPRKVNPGANYGLGFGLRGLQFVKDGQRLDDSVDAAEFFEALDGDEIGSGNDMSALEAMFSKAA